MPGQRHDKPSSGYSSVLRSPLSSPGRADLAVDKAELLKALCPLSRRTTHKPKRPPAANKANSSHNYGKLRQLKQWNNGLLGAPTEHKGET